MSKKDIQKYISRANKYKAVGHPYRLAALEFCVEEKCVGEIEKYLGIPQSAVSQHISVLRTRGLVTERRSGVFRYYKATPEAMEIITEVQK